MSERSVLEKTFTFLCVLTLHTVHNNTDRTRTWNEYNSTAIFPSSKIRQTMQQRSAAFRNNVCLHLAVQKSAEFWSEWIPLSLSGSLFSLTLESCLFQLIICDSCDSWLFDRYFLRGSESDWPLGLALVRKFFLPCQYPSHTVVRDVHESSFSLLMNLFPFWQKNMLHQPSEKPCRLNLTKEVDKLKTKIAR